MSDVSHHLHLSIDNPPSSSKNTPERSTSNQSFSFNALESTEKQIVNQFSSKQTTDEYIIEPSHPQIASGNDGFDTNLNSGVGHELCSQARKNLAENKERKKDSVKHKGKMEKKKTKGKKKKQKICEIDEHLSLYDASGDKLSDVEGEGSKLNNFKSLGKSIGIMIGKQQ